MRKGEIEKMEVDLLIEAIRKRYGYDFSNYARASVRRRIQKRLDDSGIKTISALQHEILYDESAFNSLLLDMSINVTEMFRDPTFFKAVRKTVLPELGKKKVIRIWHAGCATGEEVYSMAIMLKELGLYDRARIYATDVNEVVLKRAKQGIFSADRMRNYTTNYQKAGGTGSFADYYLAKDGLVMMNKELKKNMIFSDHNLVTDKSFGRMDLVICRNVLIYFNKQLQDSVIGLFANSLMENGILCLGSKESLRFNKYGDSFSDLVKEEKIFRKKTGGAAG